MVISVGNAGLLLYDLLLSDLLLQNDGLAVRRKQLPDFKIIDLFAAIY